MPRILRIAEISGAYVRQFFHARPALLGASYADIQRALEADHASSSPAYSNALERVGNQCTSVFHNAGPLQRSWARERGIRDTNPGAIAVHQAVEFQPDVLWFDSPDGNLIRAIRAALPRLRLAIGWEGSALSAGGAWPYLDCVFSCAPESVSKLRAAGIRSEHMHHGFDAGITPKLGPSSEELSLSFVGSLIRRAQYHVRRDALLTKLSRVVPVQIFSPAASVAEHCKMFASGILYAGSALSRAFGVDPDRLPHVVRRSASPLRAPINRTLRPLCRPPVFGLKYFQTVSDSRVSLNIHADSSPAYASNMRLFEVTGAGSCLLTDYKPNLASLFDLDTQVVAYRTDEECIEKARWLLDHPAECRQIADRAQKRTLAQHTVYERARQLDEFIGRSV